MGGFITKLEVEDNKEFIIETYGEDFYIKCLEATGETFLGLLMKEGKI